MPKLVDVDVDILCPCLIAFTDVAASVFMYQPRSCHGTTTYGPWNWDERCVTSGAWPHGSQNGRASGVPSVSCGKAWCLFAASRCLPKSLP